MTTKITCEWKDSQEAKIDVILNEDPNAEIYVDFYPPCEGCMSRKGGYNGCSFGY